MKHATSELVRRKTTGQPLEDEEPESKVARGRKMWKGKIDVDDLWKDKRSYLMCAVMYKLY